MTVEIALVLGLTLSAVILFATEKLPVDLTAMIIMCTMLLSGMIAAEDAIGGFSNPATVTVGAMFVLSAGLFKTGAVNVVGGILTRLGRINFWLVLIVMMLLVGSLSAFINNTAAVAIFLPVAMSVAVNVVSEPETADAALFCLHVRRGLHPGGYLHQYPGILNS